MNKTFYSYSFGCRLNEAEKEEIDRLFLAAGFSHDSQKPAIHIVNTCAVTAKAEREARQYIYKTRRSHPDSKIVITGCSATYWKKLDVYQKLPVDLLVENTIKQFLVDLVLKRFFSNNNSLKRLSESRTPTSKFLKSGRAMIKIQDGCQRFCSYCIVPYLRGLPKSFLINDVVKKINSLNGISEVILTAINTEAYGFDTGENLIKLIRDVIKKTSVPKISFGSIHPWSIGQKFIDNYQYILRSGRFANFFHVPLQSGSDKILKLMKRGYTTKEFAWKINAIKKVNPFALVATDVIVGFIDESDRDFEETFNYLKTGKIDKFHIFRFSGRDKTAAYYMRNRLSEAPSKTKIKRAKILAELSEEKYHAFLDRLVQAKYQSDALFIDKINQSHQQALMDNQVPVWVKVNKNCTGDIKHVKIEGLRNNVLFGKLEP